MVFVEELLKLFGVVLPTLVENMCVSVCHNLCLCMAGISLYGLDVTASQLELVSDAGMSQAMHQHHRGYYNDNQCYYRLPGFSSQTYRDPNRNTDSIYAYASFMTGAVSSVEPPLQNSSILLPYELGV